MVRKAFHAKENEAQVREAYAAYGRGDMTKLLQQVHPDLEWTFLDPSTPGADQRRAWPADDRSYLVLTLAEGQIVAMRNFRDREESRVLTSLE